MKKLVVIGGGGMRIPALVDEISRSALGLEQIYLFDIGEALQSVVEFCRRIVAKSESLIEVNGSDNPELAFRDTDVALFLIGGGLRSDMFDDHHLAFSGITGHARSYPKAIRLLNPVMGYCSQLQDIAPQAKVVVFSNPVSMICEAMARYHTDLDCYGVCYHSFDLHARIAGMIGVDVDKVTVDQFGINHISFIFGIDVDGEPYLDRAIEKIERDKRGDFNYPLPRRIGMIPISEAYSLFFKGEKWKWTQDGRRSPLRFFRHRYFNRSAYKDRIKQADRTVRAIRDGNLDVVQTLHRDAPWFHRIIAPFLRLLDGSDSGRFIITRPNEEHRFSAKAAERVYNFENGELKTLPFHNELPQFVLDSVEMIHRSEASMIEGIVSRSKSVMKEALLLHPNVKDMDSADRFVEIYFDQLN